MSCSCHQCQQGHSLYKYNRRDRVAIKKDEKVKMMDKTDKKKGAGDKAKSEKDKKGRGIRRERRYSFY